MALKTLYATFEAERAEQQYHDLMLEQILGSDVRDAIMEAAEEEDTKETKRDKTGHPEEDGESKDSDKKSKDSDEEDTDDSKDSKKSDKEDEEASEESFFMDEDAILNYVGEADEVDAEDAEAEDTVTEDETEETEDEEPSEEDEALEALIDSIPETDPSECGECAPVGSVEEALIFDEIDRLVPDTVLY